MSDGADSAGFATPAASEPVSTWTWMRWCYSARDGQVHAFPLDDSQCGRWPQAICSHVVPRGALGSAVTSPRCPWCVLGTTASGTGRRHRRIDPPGVGARLLARFRRYRPTAGPTSSSSAEFPVIALPRPEHPNPRTTP